MLGPQEVEFAWNKFESQIVERLSKISWIKPLSLVAFVFFAYFTFDLWTQSQFPGWSRFYIAQDRSWVTYLLIGFSFIPLFLKQLRNKPLFLLIIVSFSWLYPVYRLGSASWTVVLPIVYLVFSAGITNSTKWPRSLKLVAIFTLFLALVSLLTRESLISQDSKILLYFSNLHLDLLFIYFAAALFNTKPVSYALHFNPLQLMSPFPLPENTHTSESGKVYDRQFVHGMIELLQGQILFIFLILTYQTLYVKTTLNPLIHYFLFIGFIVASMKTISALLWIYGIKSISATNFLLLSKSPIEIWQRGSVFIADFLFNKIYLPVWKRFRTQTLASFLVVFAILFHLFIFHELVIKSVLKLLFGNEHFGRLTISDLRQQGLWVAIWLIWIIVFSVFQKLSARWHKVKSFQWFLILLTHAGSAMVIPIVTFLGSII